MSVIILICHAISNERFYCSVTEHLSELYVLVDLQKRAIAP